MSVNGASGAWAADALFGPGSPLTESPAETHACFRCREPLIPSLAPGLWLTASGGREPLLCSDGSGRLHSAQRVTRA